MSDEYSKGLSYNGWQPLDFLLWDMPGKGLPCLHEQVFAPLRTVLDACHWHAAPLSVAHRMSAHASAASTFRAYRAK